MLYPFRQISFPGLSMILEVTVQGAQGLELFTYLKELYGTYRLSNTGSENDRKRPLEAFLYLKLAIVLTKSAPALDMTFILQ